MVLKTSCSLTILEGPDGAGKTTLGRSLTSQLKASMTHLGRFPRVTNKLARFYAEAMLPAVLGYQPIIMDRSWLAEEPYGRIMRGYCRLDELDARLLERLALRTGAVVIQCLPPWDTVRNNYLKRRSQEYPSDLKKLRLIYQAYEKLPRATALPVVRYDYTRMSTTGLLTTITAKRAPCHPLSSMTAGKLTAKVLLVGERFADQKNDDLLYQWPFASFNQHGCSRWLTAQLQQAKITEDKLCWVNADQPLEFIKTIPCHVIALGEKAQQALEQTDMPITQVVPHPQYWKRFHHQSPYPLIATLKKILQP